jgi:hypothetical protein
MHFEVASNCNDLLLRLSLHLLSPDSGVDPYGQNVTNKKATLDCRACA